MAFQAEQTIRTKSQRWGEFYVFEILQGEYSWSRARARKVDEQEEEGVQSTEGCGGHVRILSFVLGEKGSHWRALSRRMT